MRILIKFTLGVLIILELLCSCEKTEKIYYKNGVLKSIASINSDGKWDGEVKQYYENGQIDFVAEYSNGYLNGEVRWYTKKGKLLKMAKYSNGKVDGLVVDYDSIGRKYCEQDYNQGERAGYRFYDTLGKVDVRFMNLDTLHLPTLKDVCIRFDRNLNNFHVNDTIALDVRISGISKNQIKISCTKSRWIIDYRLDSFMISLMPKRAGEMDLYIYLKVNDIKEVSLGKKVYVIKD